ncbi:YARHG domain-containing protein [Lacrimispora sp. NSJ-141]|uniref:YARHG domain-containing protein n=1 Tax=Lientehia hominis TaxID=2897778 RepID=A0AAP2RFX1_9FIRM|nr:YARHG domain-containing protein [Lientehia hominis]MCD2491251.1 YARHG domain-containing protein [Lientehia hominis]
MYCEECGKQIPDDSRFCDGCGAKVWPVERQDAPPPQNWQDPYRSGQSSYDAPEKEKKGRGMTVLIAALGVVAVVLIGVLIFLGVKVFGGKNGGDVEIAGAETTSEAGMEEEKEESKKEAKTSEASVESSVTAAPTVPSTAPTTTAPVTTAAATAAESEYVLPGSDSVYLTEADLVGLTKEQLRIARNEIYARHGRKFKDAALNEYFMSKSWYTPLYEPNQFEALGDSVFNDYEVANRKLIADYEKKMGY